MRAGLRRGWGATSLRVRLIILMAVLVAVALAVTSTASTRLLRNELVRQIDQRLNQASVRLPGPSAGTLPPFCAPGAPVPRGDRFFPNERVFELLDSSGKVVGHNCTVSGTITALPQLAGTTIAQANAHGRTPFTVGSDQGSARWRVSLRTVVTDSGQHYTIASATSLADTETVVARLGRLQLGVALAVIALLAAVAAALVRLSLRPLTDIEQTAEAIAAGDLSRRVPDAHPGTEVGHLANALNGMLGQIEGALRDRAASETEARASEQRMRRFVADASHELRTPLTTIRGFAELHRRQAGSDDPEAVERFVGRIETEATRMGGLVEDLLLLARLDQDRPLRRDPIDLVPLVADAGFDLHSLGAGRLVDVHLPSDPGADDGAAPPVVVLGDEERLRQVLANLVSNALLHTPPGTPVRLHLALDEGGAAAVLDVIDAGPGFTDEQAARAFERFYRADASRTRARGGSGLGLSIVDSIVGAHGGTVELLRPAEGGAHFRVRLPLAFRPPAPPAPPATTDPATGTVPAAGHG
ncbi:MAG: Two-component system, OmpR family, sensor kinase [Acidimicrobiales bacterium]|nr:Two-component system, OmpR family, sensor kinase [Acidimicrobiales bacterium]